jgi:hypothetical protein
MGPTFTRGSFESGKFASEVMMGTSPGGALPPIEFGLCDVRDVAKAHVEACLRDEANNQRFIVAEGKPIITVGQALAPKYGESYPVLTKVMGTGVIGFLALFMKPVADMKKMIGVSIDFDCSNTK